MLSPLSIQQLNHIMPNAHDRALIYLHYLNLAIEQGGLSTVHRRAAFLANLCVESGELVYTSELASGRAYNDRADLGNTEPDAIAAAAAHLSTPGPFYKGHGLIQITGFYNHKACGEALGLDLINYPLLLTQPEHACTSAVWFWNTNNINKYADAQDFDGVCDKINRGRKTVRIGDANGYKERIIAYNRALKIMGAA